MNTAAWVVTAVGAGLLGLVALDIHRTILHSRGRSGPVTETLTRTVWRLVRGAAFHHSRPIRHRLLNQRRPPTLARDRRDAGGVDHPRLCAALLAAPARRLRRAAESPKRARHRGYLLQRHHLHYLGLRRHRSALHPDAPFSLKRSPHRLVSNRPRRLG
jgi:hypothetical protein